MRRGVTYIAMMAGGVLALTGCGVADNHALVPEFMRVKDAAPPPLEAPPDVVQLVRANLNSVFVATAYPQNVRVSPARHDPRALGWTACVRADLTNAMGKPLGTETYRISINGGVILDRQRIDANDNCVSETYQPI
jgi:hypothetical protein